MRMGELVDKLGISEHTIRFYEKEGLITPERNQSNQRIYTEDHLVWIEFIVHMKRTGMSLKELKKYKENRESDSVENLFNILVRHKEKIEEEIEVYQKNRDLINKKLDLYRYRMELDKDSLYDDFSKRYKQDNVDC